MYGNIYGTMAYRTMASDDAETALLRLRDCLKPCDGELAMLSVKSLVVIYNLINRVIHTYPRHPLEEGVDAVHGYTKVATQLKARIQTPGTPAYRSEWLKTSQVILNEKDLLSPSYKAARRALKAEFLSALVCAGEALLAQAHLLVR